MTEFNCSSSTLLSVNDTFNHIFDIVSDNYDNEQQEFENILEEYNEIFDFEYLHTNVDEEEMPTIITNKINPIHHEDEMINEQILSQKLNYISSKHQTTATSGVSGGDDDDNNNRNEKKYSVAYGHEKRLLSTPSTPSYLFKKSRTDDYYETLPVYLQISKTLFDQIPTRIHTNDLQQLCLLKHKMAVLKIDEELWSTYRKIGTGQWKTTINEKLPVDRRVWFDDVKKQIPQTIVVAAATSMSNNTDENDDQQKICETIVQEYLEQLKTNMEQYQKEFIQRKDQLLLDNDEYDHLEKSIQAFVEQHGIPMLRKEFDYKMKILEYDYDATLLERDYMRQKPTERQMQLIGYLLGLKIKCTESRLKLMGIKERILRHQSLPAMFTDVPDPNVDMNESHQQHHQNQAQHQQQQQQQHDFLIESILQTEKSIHLYQQTFDEQMCQPLMNEQNHNEGLTGKLVDIIYRCFKIIDKKLQHIYDYKINNLITNKSSISSTPSFILDTILSSHGFTNEQIQLLNRGPSYIPPFQMYILSSDLSLHDRLAQQYKLLQHHLTKLYAKLNTNTARSMFINREIKDLFMNIFSLSLPPKLYQRAFYEKQLVDSIRTHCQVNHLILKRLANQTNVFYLTHRKDFQQKINEYFTQTDTFELCETIDDTNLQQTRHYLHKIITTINSQVEHIFEKKKNSKDLIKRLHIDTSKVQLPYLYFLPEITKKNGVILKSIVVARNSATSRLGHFLDQLLRPVIQRHTQSTTFLDGDDFIYKLNEFTTHKKRFYPSTMFVSMKIKNLDTMLSHDLLLLTLQEYLIENLAIPSIDGISVNQIIHLTSLFLRHTRFYYDHKIYRFLKGSPSSLPFTDTLLNISAFHWQKCLLQERWINDAFFGRSRNHIFFTWNDTMSHFEEFIHMITDRYSHVQLDVTIGFQNRFFNVDLENRQGTLYTNVYHDPILPKYTLPYVIDNPKDVHSHWLRSALIRAVRYCTCVEDFNYERIYLEISCLRNGYSLEFVEQRIQHFFQHFDAMTLRSSLNQHVYDKFRHRICVFFSEQRQFCRNKHELERTDRRIELIYPYEYGPKREFNQKLRSILSANLSVPIATSATFISKPTSAFFENDDRLQVILHTKQSYSLNALLCEQKPNHRLINEKDMIL